MKITKKTKKAFRRVSALFLSLLFVFQLLPIFASAESPAVVTGDDVNVRSGPGTNYNSIGIRLDSGHNVTVLESAPDAKGGSIPWYKITFTYNGAPYTGYMRSDYVQITPTLPPDLPPMEEEEEIDFEEILAAFPEDYRESLRRLHQLHPTWSFEPFHTGLDWSAVQALENRIGWSFINDGIISHYSTAPGSYDWETDTYFVKEGSNWYQAHPDMVAYFMDPRNFLNENDIFQFEILNFSPAHTEENIAQMLDGTFMAGKTLVNNSGQTVSYARAFLDAASAYNVSAFHMVARCIQEVGWGGNACTSGTYPGYENYYNFFNIGANSGAADGMAYAKSKGWDTPYKAIQAGGALLGSSYIARGQNTPYFQKYDVVNPNSVAAHQYMTNVAAARSEGRIQKNKYVSLGLLDKPLTFRIPVYNNMPSSVCAAPAPAGSPNNYLTSLSVDGYSLAPTFDFYDTLNNGTTSYTLSIKDNLSYVHVSATAAGKAATVSGNVGDVPVSFGVNTLVITCTAANGAKRDYTVKLNLIKPDPTDPDQDGSGVVDSDDAVYLLYHLSFPEAYPLRGNADFDRSGAVDLKDAFYLLYHINFPEFYPIDL